MKQGIKSPLKMNQNPKIKNGDVSFSSQLKLDESSCRLDFSKIINNDS
jgi:hypothetical protein